MAQRRRLSLIAALALAACAAGCGSSSHSSAATTTTTAATASTTTAIAPATTEAANAVRCTKTATPHLGARTEPRPKTTLDPAKRYVVTFQTTCGSFQIQLAVGTSPHVTASFADLVRRHYFDGTFFHRIIPGFVIQGGDPTGTGGGGPGYTTVDAPPASTRYTVGLVAMAKTTAQPAGTSGSQFFVVTGNEAASLTPDYAVLGRIVSGLDVVKHIGQLGDASGVPSKLVEITHASVSVH